MHTISQEAKKELLEKFKEFIKTYRKSLDVDSEIIALRAFEFLSEVLESYPESSLPEGKIDKDSLTEELEELKGEAIVLAHNEYFWTASCDTGKNTDRIEADGNTPLAAVLALKETLNSNQ